MCSSDLWSPSRHRLIGPDEVIALLPALAGREPSGGYLFYDCQTDDVRLVLSILEEAERFGAICANRIEALELAAEGVAVRDVWTGESFTVEAENVINATGVWADRIRSDELHSEAEVPVIHPSRGTHITLSREDLPLEAGAVVPAGSGRFIFALPWLGRSLIGTTDNDYDGDIEHVRPPLADIEYLLEATNGFFGTSLGLDAVTGAYAGVRPLISTGDTRKSVDISRKAELYETSSGLITITGGKLTTWRRMAKLAVDRLVERDGRTAPCRTHEIPLGESTVASSLPRVEGVGAEAYEALARRYGHAAEQVLQIASERHDLRESILPPFPDVLAEAVYAARCEQAATVADVLLRRTRLGLLAARPLAGAGAQVPRRVAAAMGRELGWDSVAAAQEAASAQQEIDVVGLDLAA